MLNENKDQKYQVKQVVSHADYLKCAVKCTLEQVGEVGLMPEKPATFEGSFGLMYVKKAVDDRNCAQIMAMGAMTNEDLACALINLVSQFAEVLTPLGRMALRDVLNDYFDSKHDTIEGIDFETFLRSILGEMGR